MIHLMHAPVPKVVRYPTWLMCPIDISIAAISGVCNTLLNIIGVAELPLGMEI